MVYPGDPEEDATPEDRDVVDLEGVGAEDAEPAVLEASLRGEDVGQLLQLLPGGDREAPHPGGQAVLGQPAAGRSGRQRGQGEEPPWRWQRGPSPWRPGCAGPACRQHCALTRLENLALSQQGFWQLSFCKRPFLGFITLINHNKVFIIY